MDGYFERFGFCDQQVVTRPRADLGLVVVVPCYDEPDLIGGLEQLWRCDRPSVSVEVMVVVNSSADCSEAVRVRNRRTLEEVRGWAGAHSDPGLAVHLLDFPALPVKQAGVGLARKIGMDEGLRRFEAVGRTDSGIIVNFDADCGCDSNYLQSVERHFLRNTGTPGCSIYFEHPLEGGLGTELYEAVTAYELHLRYYVQALRFAGFPHAFHTVGSSMAVRAAVYRDQGGMNRRKAGEDFYFLNKVMALGGYTELLETRVLPSPRPSDRVPFGTGRAVRAYLEGRWAGTYPLEAFLDLKGFFERIPLCYARAGAATEDWVDGLSDAMVTFLEGRRFGEVVKEIYQHTGSESMFRKRFFRWFDGFRVMKWIHHARDSFYGAKPVELEAGRLRAAWGEEAGERSGRAWLEVYRKMDRSCHGTVPKRPLPGAEPSGITRALLPEGGTPTRSGTSAG